MRAPNTENALTILDDILKDAPAIRPKCVHDSVVLYGAGQLGKLALRYLKEMDVNVEFIVDRGAVNGSYIDGTPLYRPEFVATGKDKPILVSTASDSFSSIRKQLSDEEWETIIPFYDYAQSFKDRHPLSNGWFTGKLSRKDRLGIRSILFRLDDNHSRAAYIQCVAWRLSRRDLIFDGAPVQLDNRYFIDEIIKRLTDKEDFLDIGAYDGRVLVELLAKTGDKINSATLIEPDKENLKLLEETMVYSIVPHLRSRINILPSVASNIDGKVDFCHGFGFASKPGKIKQSKTHSVKIDSLNLKPSFVKIHTEGSELDVILGAKDTLVTNRPMVASTLYHSRDGLWETPLRLMAILSDYRFYFRLHSWCGTGAVIYAIPR